MTLSSYFFYCQLFSLIAQLAPLWGPVPRPTVILYLSSFICPSLSLMSHVTDGSPIWPMAHCDHNR